MALRILSICALSFALVTPVMAQQTQTDSNAQHQPEIKMTPNTDATKLKSPPAAATTVDPGITGSTANGDSGMPNANGNAQGCNGSASNLPDAKRYQATSNAPGANCQ